MEEYFKRLLFAKFYSLWSVLNVDIDPFFVILDINGEVVMAKRGNNLAEDKGGSLQESFRRAQKALRGKRPKGGSRIYWLSGNYPGYKRIYLGAAGISGLGFEREHPLVRKLAGFRSWWHISPPMIYDGNIEKLIDYSPEKLASCENI